MFRSQFNLSHAYTDDLGVRLADDQSFASFDGSVDPCEPQLFTLQRLFKACRHDKTICDLLTMTFSKKKNQNRASSLLINYSEIDHNFPKTHKKSPHNGSNSDALPPVADCETSKRRGALRLSDPTQKCTNFTVQRTVAARKSVVIPSWMLQALGQVEQLQVKGVSISPPTKSGHRRDQDKEVKFVLLLIVTLLWRAAGGERERESMEHAKGFRVLFRFHHN